MPTNYENPIPCSPPRWLRGPHQQTLWSYYYPYPSLPLGERIELPLPDGDRLVLFEYEGPSDTVVTFFHGLGGCTLSNYMQRSGWLCRTLGHTFRLVNHRGCGPGEGLAIGPYHAGRADDLSHVLKDARERFPQKRHIAIGFSLSANALLLLLTKSHLNLPDAALVVNPPSHLAASCQALQRGFSRVYDFHFYQLLRKSVKRRGQKPSVLARLGTLYDFDNLYTAPMAGFKNAEDYYFQCSTYDKLDRIQTPTVILTSKDDPFVPYEPIASAKRSQHVHLHLENFGGHMGYWSGKQTPLGSHWWLDYALAHFLKQI